MKRFSPARLERALDLYEHVDANRWELIHMPSDDRRLHCEFWVFKARALLEADDLSEHDGQACQWVLGVARAIAAQLGLYIYGISRHHHDDWASRARAAGKRIRARQRRPNTDAVPPRKSKVAETHVATEDDAPLRPLYFPRLDGTTVLIIGGEPDNVVLDRFRGADFTLDWIPTNIRQVQAVTERIRSGKLGGVIFLADLNRHASFALVRDACRLSQTPMTLATRGLAGIRRALEQLNARSSQLRQSA